MHQSDASGYTKLISAWIYTKGMAQLSSYMADVNHTKAAKQM